MQMNVKAQEPGRALSWRSARIGCASFVSRGLLFRGWEQESEPKEGFRSSGACFKWSQRGREPVESNLPGREKLPPHSQVPW
jgi:hypothetical protein